MFDVLKWFRERGGKLPDKDAAVIDKTLGLKTGTAATVNDTAVEGAIELTEARIAGLTTAVAKIS